MVSGVGVGAGALMVQGCFPGNSVILFQITGDQDIKVPLSGGGSYSVVSAEMSVSQFARANSCISVKEFRPDIDWECPNSSAGKLVIGTNQGHQWNSNWTELMISFLGSHVRP